MTEIATDQVPDPGQWKKKYYDQLDYLDAREKEWDQLESVLKRAVGRLCIVAEGHYHSLDKYIRDIRNAIRKKINAQRLDKMLDGLSDGLRKLEKNPAETDKRVVSKLRALLEGIDVPDHSGRQKKRLLKRLVGATDKDSDDIVSEMLALLSASIASDNPATTKAKGLFPRLFGLSSRKDRTVDGKTVARHLAQLVRAIPWPDTLNMEAMLLTTRAESNHSQQQLEQIFQQVGSLITDWKGSQATTTEYNRTLDISGTGNIVDLISHLHARIDWPDDLREKIISFERQLKQDSGTPEKLIAGFAALINNLRYSTYSARHTELEIEIYRRCLLSFIDQVDKDSATTEKISALRNEVNNTDQKPVFLELITALVHLLNDDRTNTTTTTVESGDHAQPVVRELLLQLLERLVLPADLNNAVENIKTKLDTTTAPEDWRLLLEDMAALIDSMRGYQQQERNDFEKFLQQIGGRLDELDEFLRQENTSLHQAGEEARIFDVELNNQVRNIRDNMMNASELNDLKHAVEQRLDVMSVHIKNYRAAEEIRYLRAQKNLDVMQSRMGKLEKESRQLKKSILEKNRESLIDSLTGIPNRLAYEKRVAEEISRRDRFETALSLVVLDIDYFKRINDSYGHRAGDKALRMIAQLLIQRIRQTDFLGRYGGEEFVMLLPDTNEEEALVLVDELREQVGSSGFHYEGVPVTITLSCGISDFRPGDMIETVFERADQALYRAKENGRNQCAIAT